MKGRFAHPSAWSVVAIGVLFTGTLTARIVAQDPTQQSAPATGVTTKTAVYTDAQATKGESTYSNTCLGCHTPDEYTSAGFHNGWNGYTVWDLFSFVSETMPEDLPGALTPAEYADIIAYILKLNRAPAGPTPLPTDEAALKKIKLELGSR